MGKKLVTPHKEIVNGYLVRVEIGKWENGAFTVRYNLET